MKLKLLLAVGTGLCAVFDQAVGGAILGTMLFVSIFKG